LLPLIQLAKQFNPAAPDVPEDQFKKAINELKKESTIAAGFDKAKDAVTDIIIAGNADDTEGKSVVVLIKAPEAVTPEAVEAMSKLVPKEQVKITPHKKDKATIFEFEVPQAPVAVFLTVPEAGVLAISMDKDAAEKLVDRAAGNGKPEADAAFAKLMSQRKPTDFLFAAAIKGEAADREVTVGSLVLDKDVTGSINVTYGSEERAKKKAESLKENIDSATESLKEMLADKKEVLEAILAKTKTKIDGKTVTAEFSVSGASVEKLLAKDS
jgi:hypothetical protein